MECLKFNLNGRMAHFKNPENNIYIEFTFNNIHKPGLLGILGAVLGLDGRNQKEKNGCIEYFEKLKDIKVSIVPQNLFEKFVDEINNSTGFANDGMVQQIRREYIKNPSWDIYLIKNNIDNKIWEELKENILNGISVYPLGLGGKKNSAKIINAELINIENAKLSNSMSIDSLILSDDVLCVGSKLGNKFDFRFKLEEYLPVSLNEIGLYEKSKILFTGNKVELKNNNNVYLTDNNKVLYFI